MTKKIHKLNKEKEDLKERLADAENLQTPDYHHLRKKIDNLELKNQNLIDAAKSKDLPSSSNQHGSHHLKRALQQLKQEKDDLLDQKRKGENLDIC